MAGKASPRNSTIRGLTSPHGRIASCSPEMYRRISTHSALAPPPLFKSVHRVKEIMSPDESVKAGQLVRYLQTTTRWQFARVRRVYEEEIELSFFDGAAPIKVPRTQVESLETFFDGRKRVLVSDAFRTDRVLLWARV